MIDWTDNIQQGTTITIVKDNQPSYLTIDRENPIQINQSKKYLITKIKGNKSDVLSMSHYLVFINDRYQWRDSVK